MDELSSDSQFFSGNIVNMISDDPLNKMVPLTEDHGGWGGGGVVVVHGGPRYLTDYMRIAMCAAACVEVCIIIPINCSRSHATILGTMLPIWFAQSHVSSCKKGGPAFSSGPIFYI